MMNQPAEQPVNVKAAAWTVGVHVALLLLFILFKYTIPAVAETIPDMGMEVNLGTSDNGSGTDQPMDVEDPAPPADTRSASRAVAQQDADMKDMMRSDDADAPAVTTTNNNKPVTRNNNPVTTQPRRNNNNPQQTTTNNNNPQPQRPRYVYNGATGRDGNRASANRLGGNEGNTSGPGDRGVPGGIEGASNYVGSPGSGTGGISHNISGRNIVAFPNPDADFREGGKVVIRITVNKNGSVVNKQVVSASNAELRAIALRKVEKVRFNKSDDAPEEQFGNITFVFKTRS